MRTYRTSRLRKCSAENTRPSAASVEKSDFAMSADHSGKALGRIICRQGLVLVLVVVRQIHLACPCHGTSCETPPRALPPRGPSLRGYGSRGQDRCPWRTRRPAHNGSCPDSAGREFRRHPRSARMSGVMNSRVTRPCIRSVTRRVVALYRSRMEGVGGQSRSTTGPATAGRS